MENGMNSRAREWPNDFNGERSLANRSDSFFFNKFTEFSSSPNRKGKTCLPSNANAFALSFYSLHLFSLFSSSPLAPYRGPFLFFFSLVIHLPCYNCISFANVISRFHTTFILFSYFFPFSFSSFFLPPRTPVSLSLFSSSPMSPTFSPSLAFALIFFSNFRPRRRAIFHFPSRIVDEVGCVRQPPSRREFHIYKRVNIYSTLVDSFLLIHCPFFRLFYSFPFYHSDRLPPILQHETLYTSFAFL